MLSIGDSEEPRLFRGAETVAAQSDFSPDGRWVAFWSGDGGTNELYVRSFPAEGSVECRVTQSTGAMARWSPDGSELFYRPSPVAQSVLHSIGITTEPDFLFTAERTLPIRDFIITGNYRNYDITPDGERFLMVFPAGREETGRQAGDQMVVIPDWFTELERLVPTN